MENMKGTTTVAMLCSDGILFGADKRATMGFFIANREVNKIFLVDERIGITMAGSVADAQKLGEIMKAEISLYKMKNEKEITVKAASSLLSNIMFQYKIFPFMVQILIGGVDADGKASIYNLDPIGGVTEEKCMSTGSGSPVALGLLEDRYVEGKQIKDNAELVVHAIQMAMKRDVGSGDGIELVAITKSGNKRYKKEEINSLMK